MAIAPVHSQQPYPTQQQLPYPNQQPYQPYAIHPTTTSTSTQTAPVTQAPPAPVTQAPATPPRSSVIAHGLLAGHLAAILDLAPHLGEPQRGTLMVAASSVTNPMEIIRMKDVAGAIVKITIKSESINNQPRQPLGQIALRGNLGTFVDRTTGNTWAIDLPEASLGATSNDFEKVFFVHVPVADNNKTLEYKVTKVAGGTVKFCEGQNCKVDLSKSDLFADHTFVNPQFV
jgi:hypothetical protein